MVFHSNDYGGSTKKEKTEALILESASVNNKLISMPDKRLKTFYVENTTLMEVSEGHWVAV